MSLQPGTRVGTFAEETVKSHAGCARTAALVIVGWIVGCITGAAYWAAW